MQRRWRIGAEPTIITLTALIAAGMRATRHTGDIASDIAIATTVALLIRRWIRKLGDRLTDIAAERRDLQDRMVQCQAATAANNALRARLRADAGALQNATEQRIAEAEARADQRIEEERSAIRQEFEEKRAAEFCEIYEMAVTNERNGLHDKTERPLGEVIMLSQRRRPVPADTASN